MDLNTILITIVWLVVLAVLLVAGAVASYLRLLMRRLTVMSARKLFRPPEPGRITIDRERVGVSISALHGAAMHLFAVGVTALLVLRRPDHFWGNVGAALVIVLTAVAVADQLIPFLLVARHDEPEVILEHWMPAVRRLVYLALPLTFLILISTTMSRLLESTEQEPEPPTPAENLQEFIEVGQQDGLIEKGEAELVQSVVEFGDKLAREVMTPRTEIAGIDVNASLEDLRKLFREKRLTRYPVYNGQMDRIEGIVNVRDLMELPPEEQSRVTIRSLVRPVPFVPETRHIKELMKELQKSTVQMAIVIDEYGSVAGLVTIEDMLEEIVGEIKDEFEPHAQDIVKEAENSYLVSGHTDLSQLGEELHVPLQVPGYSTVAGLVLAHLGHVPVPGEKVQENGVIIEVLEANKRTVLKVRLTLTPQDTQAAADHGGAH
ncbi:MAG: hemolysin family protein [Terriglobia bacterium]|jgi:CBS domain containing-hemolysin-like protein